MGVQAVTQTEEGLQSVRRCVEPQGCQGKDCPGFPDRGAEDCGQGVKEPGKVNESANTLFFTSCRHTLHRCPRNKKKKVMDYLIQGRLGSFIIVHYSRSFGPTSKGTFVGKWLYAEC